MLKEIIVGVVTAITIAIIFFLWSKFETVSINIPVNAVVAFSDDECPRTGWEEYKPAYGQFIRGIDKSQANHDPDGLRFAGSLQKDTYPIHNHTAYMQVGAEPPNGNGGAKSHRAAGGHGQVASDSERYEHNELLKPSGSGTETRPKNVALLYCIKK